MSLPNDGSAYRGSGSDTWRDRLAAEEASQHELPSHTEVRSFEHDTQTDMLPGYPESAICVQRFDDSLNSAIHTTYRNWLRSSSMHEPRDPPLEVVTFRFLSRHAEGLDTFGSRL